MMKPESRTTLNCLSDWIGSAGISLKGMARELRRVGKDLPSECSELRDAVNDCEQSIARLSGKLDDVYEADRRLRGSPLNEGALTDAEINQLMALNRRLMTIGPFLRSIASDVTPRLEAKLADPNDQMYDYEFEVSLDYILREDDPDYKEDDDNILTSRCESLEHLKSESEINYSERIGPGALSAEPHCWYFHDLYDHAYGVDAPRLSFHDCLRVGRIFIDVQVWQQYDFNLLGSDSEHRSEE